MKKTLTLIMTVIIFLLPCMTVSYASTDTAHSACVINAVTGDIVYQKNADTRMPMASTTKIMTALIALEKCKLDEVVTISQNAASQEGSSMYAKAGEQIYMEDMLYALMLNSGNDAAMAIAEHIAGSPEKFADMMNQKAWSIGAGNTSFCNPSGLPQDAHFTTAKDLALITQCAMKNSMFRTIVKTRSRTVWPINNLNNPHELYNHNKLLTLYDGAIGVKTGYTEAAGRCLVSAAERDNMTFIAVTLNDSDDWNTHMQMLDDAFASHYPKKALEKGQVIKNVTVDNKTYSFYAAEDFYIPMPKNKKIEINAEINVENDLKTPINKDEKVGYVALKYKGKEIGRVDVLSSDNIYGVSTIRMKNSFLECWKNIWSFFLL
ncbi:MAG: D-alanyl-D-alanine carboxypeptidase family protein [Monoglobales bacterium]